MSMHNPMVSIIMPVYNASAFLDMSIGDILRQSFDNYELICVDDGSTDESLKILNEYARSDDRLIVIHQDNRGGGAARNKGIENARGKYLLFLDADDRFERNLLQTVIETAETEGPEIVIYDADTFDNTNGEKRKAQWLITDSFLSEDNPFMTVNNTVWNKLFLRELIEKNRIRFTERRAAYSTSFVACALICAKRIRIVDKILLHYRTNNPNSNVTNEDKDPTAIFDAMLEVRTFLERSRLFSEKKDLLLYLCEKEFKTRLSFMKTYEGYQALYNEIHERIRELIEENGVLNATITGFLDNVRRWELSEWLYNNTCEMKSRGVIENRVYFFPIIDARQHVNVAIYGAGCVGKDYASQVMRNNKLKLVCWVDRNYENIGFPIQAPETLLQNEFDVVVVAVSDRRTAETIIQSIIRIGVDEKKIVFKEPEYI